MALSYDPKKKKVLTTRTATAQPTGTADSGAKATSQTDEVTKVTGVTGVTGGTNTITGTSAEATTAQSTPSMELSDVVAGKPNDYVSDNQEALDSLYEKIMSRPKFNFELDGSALWDQYKDQYTRLGQQAMADTMGQAAGLTGGYGSSYSQNAGQQAYNAYMQALSEKIPDLYSQAKEVYDADTAMLYDQYSVMADKEASDYSRWQDAYDRWYNQYLAAQEQANWQKEFDYSTSKSSGSGSSGSSSSGSSSSGSSGDAVDEYMFDLAYKFAAEGKTITDVMDYLNTYYDAYSDELASLFWEVVQYIKSMRKNESAPGRAIGTTESMW